MSLTGFTSPLWFLLLVVVAALAVGYVWMQRRRRRQVLRFANLAMLERVAPHRQGWYRHLPVALLLAGQRLVTLGRDIVYRRANLVIERPKRLSLTVHPVIVRTRRLDLVDGLRVQLSTATQLSGINL